MHDPSHEQDARRRKAQGQEEARRTRSEAWMRVDTSTMEVKMSDRVDDIVKKTPISDQDVYVTSGGNFEEKGQAGKL